ncbi:MAG: alpha/beta fold hydrolase [Thermodesulfobacteriota bacterium]
MKFGKTDMLVGGRMESGLPVREEYITVSDGVALKVFDFKNENDNGDGPVVVFVAGWVSLISGWTEVLGHLGAHYRTLYVETREKRSARLPENQAVDFSVPRMRMDIRELIERKIEDGRPFYLAGSSLGATIILDYMAGNVRQPQAALLISPICDFPFPPWLLFIIRFVPAGLYTLVRPILKLYLKHFRLDRKKEPEQVKKYEGTIDAAEPIRLKANAYALKDYSLWNRLHLIQAPVVIIGAKSDTLHGIETLEKMVALLPSARLELMQSNKETHSEKVAVFMTEEIARREHR